MTFSKNVIQLKNQEKNRQNAISNERLMYCFPFFEYYHPKTSYKRIFAETTFADFSKQPKCSVDKIKASKISSLKADYVVD